MAEVATPRSRWLRAWPWFLAGFCGQLLGFLLARWLPFHSAMGIGAFVAGTLAGVVFVRREPPKWGLPRWFAPILMGLATGLSIDLLWFFFP